MKSAEKWAVYYLFTPGTPLPSVVSMIRQEYDDVLREKIIQQLWVNAKGLSGKDPKMSLAIVERIVNETKVEET